VQRTYDGVIATGRADDFETMAEDYRQNTGWTPDGGATFGSAFAAGRAAMPDGRATLTIVVAEGNRGASLSVWDGTVIGAGTSVDFQSAEFIRVVDHKAAEHWDTIDAVRRYQSVGLLASDTVEH